MPEILTRFDFNGCLDTVFRIGAASNDQIELTLAQVSELRTSPGQENFSILFRGPGNRQLPQGTYTLSHDLLGEQDIFIVPVARDEQGISYEAVFNQLVS
jgi:hypothetical protein